MLEEPKSAIFDYERYGVFLRTARQKAGYSKADNFCDAVTVFTGVKINKEALYRIEKGVQPPTVEQLIAFGLILYHGNGINDVLNKTELHHCVTPYAEHLAENKGDLEGFPAYDGTLNKLSDNGYWVMESMIHPDEWHTRYIDEYYLERL